MSELEKIIKRICEFVLALMALFMVSLAFNSLTALIG